MLTDTFKTLLKYTKVLVNFTLKIMYLYF